MMTAKMKQQLILIDYEQDLLKKMHRLMKAWKSVEEYKEEFYRVLIKTSHVEANKEKVSRYINGLRPTNQEELSLV